MQESSVRSLDWEVLLEKEKATHSSILAWRIPWTPWGCKESDTTEQLSLHLLSRIYCFPSTILNAGDWSISKIPIVTASSPERVVDSKYTIET